MERFTIPTKIQNGFARVIDNSYTTILRGVNKRIILVVYGHSIIGLLCLIFVIAMFFNGSHNHVPLLTWASAFV
jgi:hypothetical protein